jgi:hypothetical protein
MNTNRPLKVFLCHSSADKPAVRELYQKLRAEPWIDPWLDEEELYPGQDWNMEIEKAVEAADAIIVCLTKSSITKEGYVQRELRIVLDFADYKPEGTLYIMPVRLEECEPPRRLRVWQYADYFESQRERAFQRLLVSLKRRAEVLGLKLEQFVYDEKELPSLDTEILDSVNNDEYNTSKNSDALKKESSLTVEYIDDLSILPWLNDVNQTVDYLTQIVRISQSQAAFVTHKNNLWAHAGSLSQNAVKELAQTVTHNWDGQKGSDLLRFIRLESTKAEHMLYATRLTTDVVLALVFYAETPFSTIRYHAGQVLENMPRIKK